MSDHVENMGQRPTSGQPSFMSAQIFVNILVDPKARQAFLEDREDYLAHFDLSQREFEEIMGVETDRVLAGLREALGQNHEAAEFGRSKPSSRS